MLKQDKTLDEMLSEIGLTSVRTHLVEQAPFQYSSPFFVSLFRGFLGQYNDSAPKLEQSPTNFEYVSQNNLTASDLLFIKAQEGSPNKYGNWFATIGMCLEEALVNAARHGNKLDPSKRIVLREYVGEKGIVYAIEDEGAGFDVADTLRRFRSNDPSYHHLKTHGLGIERYDKTKKLAVSFNHKGNAIFIQYLISGNAGQHEEQTEKYEATAPSEVSVKPGVSRELVAGPRYKPGDDFGNQDRFREEAKVRGLAFELHTRDINPRYILDLNNGVMVMDADPKKLYELAVLARDYSESDYYGEHNAILSVVCRRTDLQNPNVYFDRAYMLRGADVIDSSLGAGAFTMSSADLEAHRKKQLAKTVSVREFLEFLGFDMSKIYREKR